MIQRIEQIIAEKQLSIGQFADLLEVQRSGMSHILSGRNNPSLHFIKRILQIYPDINPRWLLFGEGTMYLDTKAEITMPDETTSVVNKNTTEVSKPTNEKIKMSDAPHFSKKRTIEKIVIFYNDGTFEMSVPFE